MAIRLLSNITLRNTDQRKKDLTLVAPSRRSRHQTERQQIQAYKIEKGLRYRPKSLTIKEKIVPLRIVNLIIIIVLNSGLRKARN